MRTRPLFLGWVGGVFNALSAIAVAMRQRLAFERPLPVTVMFDEAPKRPFDYGPLGCTKKKKK